LYRQVIAAADIDDFAVLNCSMTFTPTDNCSVIPVKPEKPFYKFVWSSPVSIHIVNASGKFAVTIYSIVNCNCNSIVTDYN